MASAKSSAVAGRLMAKPTPQAIGLGRGDLVALHGPRQPNVPIQSTMAFPISSGESS